MARGPNPADKVSASLGLRPGSRFYTPLPFSGMNTQSTPPTIGDAEFTWLENYVHLGNGKLRTAWDSGAALYTAAAPRRIVSFFFFNIAATQYAAVFLDDGSAVQINTITRAQIPMAGAGTFYDAAHPERLPACRQWGTIYLAIANRNTVNDYWLWDGAMLYGAGGASPNGVTILFTGINYASAPTITPYGGHGTGLTFSSTIQAGGVVAVKITNPGSGYTVGDTVQLQFTGGGTDNGARLLATLTAGGVAAVNVTAPGSGYTAATIAFTGGGGTGAAGTVQLGNGVISVAVTAPGSGYSGANVAFSGGGGSGAAATATVSGGQVTGVVVTDPGSGYTSAPAVAISGDGTAATATATIQNGIVVGVTMTAAGSAYTSAPNAAISGDGAGATAQSVLQGQSVAGVTVVSGGTGFQYAPTITFSGGFGAGASGSVRLTPTSIAHIDMVASGSNYRQAPTIHFNGGGGGTGATAHPTMSGGGVAAVVLTNAGSGYTDNVYVEFRSFVDTKDPTNSDPGGGAAAQAILAPTSIASVLIGNRGLQYTDAPTVVIQPGANNAAMASVDLMPFGVSGLTVESYLSRVWLANPQVRDWITIPPGGDFQVSAPGSLTDYATSDGGVQFTSSDGFLQTAYIHARQSNGYLYFFGDGSVSVASSVSTSGNPPTTTFNYQTVDPDIGCSWRDSAQPFGRTIVFANETGCFGLYGGAVQKISDALNEVFSTAVFPPDPRAVTPSAALAHLFDVKHYMVLVTVTDPDTGALRNVMLAWNEKEWFILSQGAALTYIGPQKLESKFTAWGTDGTSLFPLFAAPSANLPKRLDTKHYGGGAANVMIKELWAFYVQAQDNSAALAGVDMSVAMVLSGLAAQSPIAATQSIPDTTFITPLYANPAFQAPPPYWPVFGVGCDGAHFITVGARITTSSPDFTLANISFQYVDTAAIA